LTHFILGIAILYFLFPILPAFCSAGAGSDPGGCGWANGWLLVPVASAEEAVVEDGGLLFSAESVQGKWINQSIVGWHSTSDANDNGIWNQLDVVEGEPSVVVWAEMVDARSASSTWTRKAD
jgi:hypothetical protein